MKDTEKQKLRWKVEMTMSSLCWLKEREAKEEDKEYKCNCPDIYKMSKDELHEYLLVNE